MNVSDERYANAHGALFGFNIVVEVVEVVSAVD